MPALAYLHAPPDRMAPLPDLVPGAAVRAKILRFGPGGDAHLQMGRGGPYATLLGAERTPGRWRQGRLRKGDVLWVAVQALSYTDEGVLCTLSQLAPELPLAVLRHVAPELAGQVNMRVICREPGRQTVIAVRALDPAALPDPVALVVGPGGRHVRRAGAGLRGERIVVQADVDEAGARTADRGRESAGAQLRGGCSVGGGNHG